MVVKRKKTLIDGMDRSILRAIHKFNKPMSGSKIAKNVGLSASAIRPRLNNLKFQGIVKPIQVGKVRAFERKFVNPTTSKVTKRKIRAPRSIKWGIDFKKPKKI